MNFPELKDKVLLGTVVLSALLLPGYTAAQKISIVHKPPAVEGLPTPGELFPVSIKVLGIQVPDYEVKASVVSDGRMMEIPLQGTFNIKDEVVYKGELRAPLGEINYQFVLYRKDAAPVVSRMYSLRRACLPDITLADVDLSTDLSPKEHIRELLLAAKKLEVDINSYKRAVKVLKELRSHYNLK